MQPNDAELVQQTLSGDTDAFGELVDRYQGAVYATVYHYVGRHGATEDVAQDAFLEAYRSLPKLKDPGRFGPWLREVASRTSANWLRRHGKRLNAETPLPYRRTVPIDEALQQPEMRAERDERRQAIQAALAQLPEPQRLVVVLRYMQEMSYAEIAAFTGQTRDEVRGQLQRASHVLQGLLLGARADEEEGPQWRRGEG